MRIGLISDTHGTLRMEALEALAGAELLIHAGDIGKPEILAKLRQIAPVHAIRGNVDRWAHDLPDVLDLSLAGRRVMVVHDGKQFAPPPGVDAVICGHSHQPRVEDRDGVLFINPGSAGPRRFSLPVSVGWLTADDEQLHAELVTLDVSPPRRRR